MGEDHSIRQLVHIAREMTVYILKRWYWLVLGGILGAAAGWIISTSTPTTYQARYNFFINSDDAQMQGGIENLLGSVGFDTDDKSKIEKIKVIAKSQVILRAVLLDSVTLNNSSDYIGNHIIRLYKLNDDWAKWSKDLAKAKLSSRAHDQPTKVDNSILALLCGILIESEIKHLHYAFYHDLRSDLMEIRVVSLDESLSYELAHRCYDELSRFYIERTTEKPKKTLTLLQEKQDSLQNKLASAEAQLASFDSRNLNLWSPKDQYKRDKLVRDVSIYSAAGAEAMKNTQLASFLLQNTTPYFQIVDMPRYPLQIIKIRLPKAVVSHAIIGAGIGFILILAGFFYHSAMNE